MCVGLCCVCGLVVLGLGTFFGSCCVCLFVVTGLDTLC